MVFANQDSDSGNPYIRIWGSARKRKKDAQELKADADLESEQIVVRFDAMTPKELQTLETELIQEVSTLIRQKLRAIASPQAETSSREDAQDSEAARLEMIASLTSQ